MATDAPINMAVGLLTAVLNAVAFIGIPWHVGGDLVIFVFGHILTVPKYLVITVALYSGMVTVAITFIGRRLVHGIAGKRSNRCSDRMPEIGDVAQRVP